MDRDEVPSTVGNGDEGSSVKDIKPFDNRQAGAFVGPQLRILIVGTKVFWIPKD